MGLGDEKARSSLSAPQPNRTRHRRSINVEDLFRNNNDDSVYSSGAVSPQAYAKSQPNLRYSDVISGVGKEEVPFIDDGAQTSASREHLNASEPLLSQHDEDEESRTTQPVVVDTRVKADLNHNKHKMDNKAMTTEMYELPANGDANTDQPRDYTQLTPPASDVIESSETSSTTVTSRRPPVKIEREQCNQLDFDEMQSAGVRPTKTLRESMREFASSCECSGRCLKKKVTGLFPFLKIPKFYSMPDDLINDVIAGLTVGIMQIPQGDLMTSSYVFAI